MKNCTFYGKYPFCRQCRFNDEVCEYYNMTDKERQEYDKKFEYQLWLQKQVKEMLEDD